MKKQYLLFSIFCLLFLFSCTKNKTDFSDKKTSDSLSILLTSANDDAEPYPVRLQNNSKALKLLLDADNDSLTRANLFKVANRYFNMNNMELYRKTSRIISEKSKASNDTLNLAKAYVYLGDFFTYTSIKDSALFYYTKSEKLFRKVNSKVNLGGVFINIAVLKSLEKDYAGSELSAIQALNALRGTNDFEKSYDAYNILGSISVELKDYEKAIEYHEKALELVRKNDLNNEYHLSETSLNNLGNVYQNQDRQELAIEKFEEALRNKNLLRDKPILYAALIGNLGYSKFKMGDYSQLPELFYQSLKIRDSLGQKSASIYSKLHLSEYYAKQRDTATAKKFAKEALTNAREILNFSDVLVSLKQLGAVDPKNASQYSAEYIKLNDSLQGAERKSKDKFARIEFETDEYIIKNDRLAEQNRNMIFLFGFLIMTGVLLFVIRSQRAKTQQLLLKEGQQKANEEIYNLMLHQQSKIEESRVNEKIRIAQELHDGILGRLFGARLNLDILNKRDDENAIASRTEFLNELKHIEQDIREISHDLNREKNAVNNNFVEIVNNLIEQQESLSEAKTVFEMDSQIEWDKIENTTKINIYRILQESLQNINKYAKASEVKIGIRNTSKNLVLEVADDGIGFYVEKKNKGIGLQNMLSRAFASNGNLDIKSTPGKGTNIIFTVPKEQKK